MEGDREFVLNENLEFVGETLATVSDIKSKIFNSLKKEDEQIWSEINELKKNNFTKETIESGAYDLSGTSYTSLLIYVNEYLELSTDEADKLIDRPK